LRSKGGRGVQWRRQHIPFRVRKATRAMSDTKTASQMKPVVTPHTTVCLSKMDCEDGETPKRMGTLRNPSKCTTLLWTLFTFVVIIIKLSGTGRNSSACIKSEAYKNYILGIGVIHECYETQY